MIVVAIGNPKAWPSAIAAAMSWKDRMTARRKIAPTMPDSQIAERTPRGACRLGVERLLAERSRRVEAVDDEQGHEHADQERPGSSCRPRRSARDECRTGPKRDWWFAKNSRISAKTSIPMISVATPMLLMIDSRRTPNTLISGRRQQGRRGPMNVHIVVTPDGRASRAKLDRRVDRRRGRAARWPRRR